MLPDVLRGCPDVAAAIHLLARHGFMELGSQVLTPMHALTYGRTPPLP